MRVRLPCPGSSESVDGVARTSGLENPDGSCAEVGQIYESAVALHQTGSDQTFNKVVSIVGPGGPGNETGSVADASRDVIVMSSECREVDNGTLDKIRMWEINHPTVLYFARGFVISREQPGFADL